MTIFHRARTPPYLCCFAPQREQGSRASTQRRGLSLPVTTSIDATFTLLRDRHRVIGLVERSPILFRGTARRPPLQRVSRSHRRSLATLLCLPTLHIASRVGLPLRVTSWSLRLDTHSKYTDTAPNPQRGGSRRSDDVSGRGEDDRGARRWSPAWRRSAAHRLRRTAPRTLPPTWTPAAH